VVPISDLGRAIAVLRPVVTALSLIDPATSACCTLHICTHTPQHHKHINTRRHCGLISQHAKDASDGCMRHGVLDCPTGTTEAKDYTDGDADVNGK
jgi:hypothetical protein